MSRYPSAITLHGAMTMAKSKVFINNNGWKNYGLYCEKTYENMKSEVEDRIYQMCLELYKKYEKEWQREKLKSLNDFNSKAWIKMYSIFNFLIYCILYTVYNILYINFHF
jgi:hypothetical protein